MSRKYEIKKQVIGEDEHFERAGRLLNRVKWGRDGIKAGQGDVEASPIGTNDPRSDSMQRGGNDKSDERVDVDGDRPRPSTSGTDRGWQMTMCQRQPCDHRWWQSNGFCGWQKEQKSKCFKDCQTGRYGSEDDLWCRVWQRTRFL